MDISIVIVNWNTCNLLRDCLRSVFDGLLGLRAEVLVVDNASGDASVGMVQAEFPQVTLIESARNLGFAGGNNLALRRACGRYILLLNTDTLIHGAVLSKAVEWMDTHPKIGVMGPRVLNTDGTIQPSCSAFPSLRFLVMQALGLTRIERLDSYRMTGWDRSTERHVDVISGAAMVVRRSAMEQVGLLDEAFFFYGEETDWCLRFAQAGWGLTYVPIPAVTHFGGGSVAKLDHRRDVMMTEGVTRLHRKHGGTLAGLACFAVLTFHNASRAVFWTALGLVHPNRAGARALHFLSVVRDLPQAWPRFRTNVTKGAAQ
ncbi:N-acetylglucosaminyl-diphospho-decaprenol L-rhamnosyltransferase [Falsiruegeria litorea R37]|uniref:N-acetylglucosaminyl-diphospho-decaprenol L-rhamnosyltransferase n=1 Tax=Falsiruegeria litorea R37 TaxID=1200284 RepID=A0A1Y5TMD6_9RHOB|nr:glycosyltransferase family 2 protein [Falsiruegeria litorea]SLN67474.1 N-acetylglucosaminyl-diphospho-decaprenol L-rhamnosyltransferase [Falsiruegeria litorea R37]